MPALRIARLTLREASRRKLLLAVVILTVVVIALSGWGFHRLLQIPCGNIGARHTCSAGSTKVLASTLLTLLMFMFSFVLALGAAFLAAPAISADVESGISLSMLARPIRRSDFVLGKWLGLMALIAVYATIACGVEFVISDIVLGYVPPSPVLVVLFLIGEAMVILTLALAWSTRLPAMTGGIISLVVFGMAWMAGIAGAVGAALKSRAVENVGTISSLVLPTDGLWRAAIYHLEPAAQLALMSTSREASADPFFVAQPPANAYLIWAACWILGILGLAIWSFSRREL